MRAFSRKAQHAVSFRNGYIRLPKEVDKMDATRKFGNMQGVPALGGLGRKLAGDIWVK